MRTSTSFLPFTTSTGCVIECNRVALSMLDDEPRRLIAVSCAAAACSLMFGSRSLVRRACLSMNARPARWLLSL